MTLLPRALLACAALAGAAALTAPPAFARDSQPHVLTLRLPGGGIVEVQYTGNTAPVVMQQAAPIFAVMPDRDPAFAALEHISAMMDRQAAIMMREAATLSAMPMTPAAMPQGARFYSYASTFTSNGACTRSTEITYPGNGLKPRLISSTSGDCGQGNTAPARHLDTQHGPARLITASAADPSKASLRRAVD